MDNQDNNKEVIKGVIINPSQIKPGVVDPRHLVVPKTPKNGDMFYSDGTNFKTIGAGASGQALVNKGGVPIWGTGGGSTGPSGPTGSTGSTGNTGPTGPTGTSSSTNGCGLTMSANQTITTGTWTAVNWDTETYDVGGMHDTVTNNSRITIQTAGVYVFSFGADWAANTTGERICAFSVNGTREFESIPQVAPADGRAMMNLAFVRKLALNDYVEVQVFQTSGGNLALNKSTTGENIAQYTAQYLASGT